MGKLDIQILDALQQHGSITQAQLAERVNSTQSTCLRRVKQLKDSGHLARCVFLADPGKLERGLKAIISVVTKGHGRKKTPAFIRMIEQEAAINMAFDTTGEIDAVLMGNFASMEEYRSVCHRLFDGDPQVERYTTTFVTGTYKNTTAIATDELGRKLSGAAAS